MARYGDEVDLSARRREIQGLTNDVRELGAAELLTGNAERALQGEIQAGNQLRNVQTGASREAADASEREARVRGVNRAGIRAETEALAANTAARRANNAAGTQAAPPARQLGGTLRYATDPLLGRAQDIRETGGGVRQLRQQLGIGYTRARGLMDALESGIRPALVSLRQQGPAMDRVTAAEGQVFLADQALATAKREYAALTRNAAASEAQGQAALARVTLAEAERERARAELTAAREARATAEETVRQRVAMREANIAGLGRSLAALRERIQEATRPGREIVTHPTEFGRGGGLAGEALGTQAPRGGPTGVGGRTAEQLAALRGLQERVAPTPERTSVREIQAFTQAQEELIGAQARAAYTGRALAREYGNIVQGTRNAAAAYQSESQALRRRGALTSEFILAAARGETTVRELGYQAGVTAAKFGGWTAAATGVYGLANAARQVGEGAIAGSSGVNQLQRVINNVNADELQGQLADLAGQFNVPVDVAADAVYRMGQRFHDQADAVNAARAALYSYQTGEVDVASSTQNLIAITRGFGLSSQGLLNVYDQINQAQNVFGVRISDTEAGLAKAAGTYRQSGGDLNYLLGLFVAISQATARPGTEIGTGLVRGINQIRQATNQANLRALGVDVDPNNFQRTLQSAMQRAAQGADVNRLASGLLGNQYARLIAPVLADQTVLNQALRDTSPAAAQGSAQRELARVLQEVRQEIQAVGINLQRLGVELARAGFFNVFGALLRLVNTLLDSAGDLVRIFNRLVPPDLRPFAMGAVQAAAAIALIRRSGGLTGRVQERLPFLATPERRLQIRATTGLRMQSEEITNEMERRTRRAFVERAEAEAQANLAARMRAAYQRDLGAGRLGDEAEHTRRLNELSAADTRAITLAEEANATQQSINGMREVQLRAQQDLTTVQRLAARDVRGWLEANRIAVPAKLQTPSARGVNVVVGGREVPIAQAEAEAVGREGPAATTIPYRAGPTRARDVLSYMAEAERALEGGGANVERAQREMGSVEERIRAFSRQHTDAIRSMGYSAELMASLAGRGGRLVDQARGRLSGATGRLRGLASSLAATARGFMSGFGFLDAAIAAFFAYGYIKDRIDQADERLRQARDSISRPTYSVEQRRQLMDDVQRRITEGDQGETFGEAFTDAFKQVAHNIRHPLQYLRGDTAPSQAEQRRQIAEDARRTQQRYEQEARRVAQQTAAGGPVAGRYPEGVRAALRRNVDDAIAGVSTIAQFRQDVADRLWDITHSRHIRPQDQRLLRGQILEAQRNALAQVDPRDWEQRFGTANVEELQRQMAVTLGRIGQPGRRTTGFDLRELGEEYQYITRQLVSATDPQQILQLMQARDDMLQGIESAAEREVQELLAAARSEPERQAAFARGRQLIRATVQPDREAVRIARARGRRIQSRVWRTRQALQDFDEQPTSFGVEAIGPGGGFLQGQLRTPQQIEARRNQIRERLRRQIRALRQAERDLDRSIQRRSEAVARSRVALQNLDREEFQDRQQGREVNLALAQSRTRDPAVQAQTALRSAQRDARDARTTFGRQSREYRTAITRVNEARGQAFDAFMAGVEADNRLMTARAGTDPAAQARAALRAAQNTLNALRSPQAQGIGVDPNTITEARAGVIEAQNALAEQVRQDALDLAQIQGEIAVLRAGNDPVDAARQAQANARRALASARTPRQRLEAIRDGLQAANQLEEALTDRMTALYELREARTDDPVRQAGIRLRGSRQALRSAHGVADRRRARAEIARNARAYRDARLERREEDIDFALEMDRIDVQTAIDRYQAILRSRNLTRQQRRDILRRIHSLRDQADSSDFNLDLGNIRLPTRYDVRRALRPVRDHIRARAREAMTMAEGVADGRGPTTSATITVYVNDKNAAGDVYAAIDRAMNTNVRARMRSRGTVMR
jgi:TP901 family phage tail tape measure protein